MQCCENIYDRCRLLSWPYADDGFGRLIARPTAPLWYFLTGEPW